MKQDRRLKIYQSQSKEETDKAEKVGNKQETVQAGMERKQEE